MPVNTKHPTYAKLLPTMQMTEAAVCGEVRNEAYVPRLSQQTPTEWHNYVNRAAYFNVTERTLMALIGAAMRKPYALEGVANDVPNTDAPTFDSFLQHAIRALLTQGRLGVLVDYDEVNNTPRLITYAAEHIINWSDKFIVLEEHVPVVNPKDKFDIKTIPQWRVLELDEDRLYIVTVYRKLGQKFVPVQQLVPSMRGKQLDFIPFYFANPYDSSTEAHKPPMASLAELNIHHFRTSVDFNHGMHFTALPQPYLSGEVRGGTPGEPPRAMRIGSDELWQLEQGSTVGYLEFSGKGLGSIKEHIEHLEQQMYSVGSRLLTNKNGVESAEALQIRAGAEGAMLVTLVKALEHTLTAALATYNQWAGTAATPVLTLNKDFTAARLDPAELKELVAAYVAGTLTLESLLQQMYDGEIVADVEAEAAALRAESIAAPI